MGCPGGSDSKVSSRNVGHLGSIPGLGRYPGEGNGNPLQYSWPRKFHGWRSLVGYSPWGLKESDRTEWLHFHFHFPLTHTSASGPTHNSRLKPLLSSQARSAHHTTSQWIQEKRHWIKKYNSIQKSRLMSWSSHLVGTWMSGSFIESERERKAMSNQSQKAE